MRMLTCTISVFDEHPQNVQLLWITIGTNSLTDECQSTFGLMCILYFDIQSVQINIHILIIIVNSHHCCSCVVVWVRRLGWVVALSDAVIHIFLILLGILVMHGFISCIGDSVLYAIIVMDSAIVMWRPVQFNVNISTSFRQHVGHNLFVTCT